MHTCQFSRWSLAAALVALLLGRSVESIHAQGAATKAATITARKSAPNGAEIAAAARAASLDPSNAGTATLFGKPFKFTPARAAAGSAAASFENGAFLGVLENGAVGDETGLPAGKYNIFVAKVNGQWKGYAEAGGQVVRQAIRTTVGTASGPSKPRFDAKGWCLTVWVFPFPYRFYVIGNCY